MRRGRWINAERPQRNGGRVRLNTAVKNDPPGQKGARLNRGPAQNFGEVNRNGNLQ